MSHLISCSILEKAKYGELIWAWSYPSITDIQKDYVLKKTPIEELKSRFYGKIKNIWFYVTDWIEAKGPKFTDVSSFVIILWARDYSPDKYSKLGATLGEVYSESGDPTQVLSHFISVMTIGVCSVKNDAPPIHFSSLVDYQKTDVKGLIKTFGLEVIVIYTAILLKKKIIIYHHSLLPLLESLKSFPSLLPHMKIDEYLLPWFEATEDGIASLKNRRFFIAGCYDNTVLSRLDLADVLVNIPAKEVTVAPQAKDGLAMTKLQKDVAVSLTQLAEGDSPEADVIAKIREKTLQLINDLKSMVDTREDGREVLYTGRVKDRGLAPPLENFYLQLASAHNILVLQST